MSFGSILEDDLWRRVALTYVAQGHKPWDACRDADVVLMHYQSHRIGAPYSDDEVAWPETAKPEIEELT